MQLMLCLLAQQKVSAKDFCSLCYWANEAGCPGADFALYAAPPDRDSGYYQDSFCFKSSVYASRHVYTSGTP